MVYGGIGIFVVWGALAFWGLWLAARSGARWIRGLVWALLATTIGGLAFTVVGLVHSFAAVAHVDPSMKATVLAEGISEAMNATALSILALAVGTVALLVATIAYAVRARTPHN